MDDAPNHWRASLMNRVGRDADSGQVADVILSMIAEVEAARWPLIGRRGFDAFLSRSLHLTSLSLPWLVRAGRPALAVVDAAALRAVLSEQRVDQCAIAGVTLLQTFDELLTNLVGRSLTDRLLRGVDAKVTSS